MSIVAMDRLRLAAMAADREALLRALQRAGCVELTAAEPTEADGLSAFVRPDGAALAAAQERLHTCRAALECLDRYAPEKKKGLFRKRPVITEQQLFDPESAKRTEAAAEDLLARQQELAALDAERTKLEALRASLAPWRSVDLPLNGGGDGALLAWLGTLPTSVSEEERQNAAAALDGLAEWTEASCDRQLRYLVFVCHASMRDRAAETLRALGFSRVSFRGLDGTAEENDARAAQRLTEAEEEKKAAEQAIAAHAADREALLLALDRAGVDLRREQAKQELVQTQSLLYLEGWLPCKRRAALEAALAPFVCAYELTAPAEEDYPKVPILLENNALTRPLNMVTEMYSLPAYGTLDPNPLMAPFFVLFYGIMMADMGYGLLMMLAALVIKKKYRPKGGMDHFFGLLGLCGVSTFVFGALTGGFFGDFLTQLVSLISPGTEFALPYLFSPLDDIMAILLGAMALGLVQIVTGMAISLVEKCRRRQLLDALFEEVTWWTVFAGIALAALGRGMAVLYAGLALVILGPLVQGEGMGKLTGVFASVYNHVTGYFGDILSYSRLMALMLAGSVIAQVFNMLGAIPGNVAVFLLVSAAGNALNFALNLLGCYVHDLRLQCLEFFGKFYQDGGQPFRPLDNSTQYFDVERAR